MDARRGCTPLPPVSYCEYGGVVEGGYPLYCTVLYCTDRLPYCSIAEVVENDVHANDEDHRSSRMSIHTDVHFVPNALSDASSRVLLVGRETAAGCVHSMYIL